MDLVAVIRHRERVEGVSRREVAKSLGISRNTVKRYLKGAPVGQRKPTPRKKPALDRARERIIDELGFVPFDRAGGELLFNAIAARYERRSVLVTTNLSFSEWPKVFADDEKLTTALLDRLADRATIITTKGKNFRMRRRQGELPGSPALPNDPPPLPAVAPAGTSERPTSRKKR